MLQELFAGESLNFTTAGGAYPASSGWVLKYRLVPRTTGQSVIDITASASGDDHLVALAASTTGGWFADNYTWTSYVEKAGERYVIESGQIVIKPNPLNLTAGYDGRSQAQKALDEAKAAYAAYTASGGTKRKYRIGEREVEFNTAADIIKTISYWEAEVAGEAASDRLAKGLRPKNRILTRFVRPR